MGKFWTFRMAVDEPGVGELLLYGIIGSDSGLDWLLDEITPKKFASELQALGDLKELRIRINSEGGDVFAGQAIHSMLQRYPGKTTVIIDGIAASIASVIAMAGDVVIMPRNAMMMIHNPFTAAVGDASEFRKLADTLDSVRESITAAYEMKTGLSRERILAIMEDETWLTAEEALELGFIDEIESARKVYASLITPEVLLVGNQPIGLSRFNDTAKLVELANQGDTYSEEASQVEGSVVEFANRTLTRIDQREKAGRSLSKADLGIWESIRDQANQILETSAPVELEVEPEEPDQTTEDIQNSLVYIQLKTLKEKYIGQSTVSE